MMERLLEEVSQMHGIAETDTDMGCSVHAGDRVGSNLSRLQGMGTVALPSIYIVIVLQKRPTNLKSKYPTIVLHICND